jgi:hypothetical protein
VSVRTSGSAETARRILCDCAVTPYRADERGDILDIGRRSRTIPAAIRRAMFARDGNQCRWPNCSHQLFLEGHHVHRWENGGPTALTNLVTLCGTHHRYVHELGFYIERHEHAEHAGHLDRLGASFVFFDPKGDPIPDACSH